MRDTLQTSHVTRHSSLPTPSCVLAYNADSGAPMSVGSHWHSLYPNATFDAGMLVPSMAEVQGGGGWGVGGGASGGRA